MTTAWKEQRTIKLVEDDLVGVLTIEEAWENYEFPTSVAIAHIEEVSINRLANLDGGDSGEMVLSMASGKKHCLPFDTFEQADICRLYVIQKMVELWTPSPSLKGD